MVVFITDGDPTAFDFSEPGDPKDQGPPPDVAFRTDRSAAAREVTLDRAVLEANDLKRANTRILAVGVGSAVTGNQDSVDRLKAVSGDQVISTIGPDTSINDIDVALVRDFALLAQFLRSVVVELCTPSLTVRKFAQSPGSATYQPTAGWDITAEPVVQGGAFGWILPDSDPAQAPLCDLADPASRTCPTDADGFAAFQWEPDPADAPSTTTISEAVQPGYTAGRPGPDNDYTCEFKNEDGSTAPPVSDDFADPGNPSFDVPVDARQIITCSIWNSYNYSSDIDIQKVNAPTQIRGDLTPAAEVTSTYTVTNPGNSAITNIEVVDDKCSPVAYSSGDDGADGVLPPGLLPDGTANPAAETWTYQCTRPFSVPDSPTPGNVVNTVNVVGFDPNGLPQQASDTDDVDVYTAGIAIAKSANPLEVPKGVPSTITYTYVVTNTASLELASVTVTDGELPLPPLVNATCSPVLYVDGDTTGTPASIPKRLGDSPATRLWPTPRFRW